MTAQKGKDLLIKIHDGAGFVTVAGLRSRRIAFNAETVDVTHAESADRWRELLAGAGVRRASVSDAACSATRPPTRWCGRPSSTARSRAARWWCRISAPSRGRSRSRASSSPASQRRGDVRACAESAGALTFAAA